MWLVKDFKMQIAYKTLLKTVRLLILSNFTFFPQCFPKAFFFNVLEWVCKEKMVKSKLIETLFFVFPKILLFRRKLLLINTDSHSMALFPPKSSEATWFWITRWLFPSNQFQTTMLKTLSPATVKGSQRYLVQKGNIRTFTENQTTAAEHWNLHTCGDLFTILPGFQARVHIWIIILNKTYNYILTPRKF